MSETSRACLPYCSAFPVRRAYNADRLVDAVDQMFRIAIKRNGSRSTVEVDNALNYPERELSPTLKEFHRKCRVSDRYAARRALRPQCGRIVTVFVGVFAQVADGPRTSRSQRALLLIGRCDTLRPQSRGPARPPAFRARRRPSQVQQPLSSQMRRARLYRFPS